MANVTITADGIVQVIKIGEVISGPQGPQGVQGEPGKPLRYEDLTPTQKAELKGPKGEPGNPGAPGKDGKSLRYEDLTEQQKAELKGAKGDPGTPGAPGKDGKPGTTDYNQLSNKPDLSKYELVPILNAPRNTPMNVDYGQIDVIGANRMAQLPTEQITVETSADGVT